MRDSLVVTVNLDGVDVEAGILYPHAHRGVESASFRYFDSYLAHGSAYALDPALPLAVGTFHTPQGKPLFNAFSDSAPDRWGRNLITRNERQQARAEGRAQRTLTDIDFLVGVDDELRQGALRLRDDAVGYLADSADGIPQLVSLPALLRAADAVSTRNESPQELRDLLAAGGSLGGARPKAAAVDGQGRLCIVKFPKKAGDDAWDVIGWEKTTLDLAERAGINATNGELVTLDGRHAVILPRFDRITGRRIGFISGLTALEASDGEPRSYLELVEWLQVNGSRPEHDAQQLWRRVAFTIAIGNTDDHLRNHGFLHSASPAGWTLSPAFDINPTPDSGVKTLSTAIDYDNRTADFDVALENADYFRLSLPEARAVLDDVASSLTGWRRAAEMNNLSASDIDVMSETMEDGLSAVRTAVTPAL
jgi:serine/threonine-protein kinase HipA